jgi:hypothetical protein
MLMVSQNARIAMRTVCVSHNGLSALRLNILFENQTGSADKLRLRAINSITALLKDNKMQSLIRRISRFAARHFAKSWLPFHALRGVVSFSF